MNAPIETKTKKAPTPIETVTMSDGRAVDFPGKRKLQKQSSVTADGAVQVVLDFRNGQTRTFTLPQALLNKFAAHGAEQKLGDQVAGLDDVDDMVEAVDELIDRLYNGDWNEKRDSSGMAGASILLKALVESTGKTVEQIRTWLSGKSHAEKVALRGNERVKPIVERLEAEKAARGTKVDTDGLLAELGDSA